VVGETVSLALLHRVLANLLRDGIPIRDLAQIVESLSDNIARSKDPSALTELARKALIRTITEQHSDFAGRVKAMLLDPAVEYELRNRMGKDDGGLPPDRAMDLVRRIADVWKKVMEQGHDGAVLLCDATLRPHLAGMLARQVPQLAVLAYDEIAPGAQVESVGSVSPQEQPAGLPMVQTV
jgi:flagellar biosynthesis protein FlhA